MDHNSSTDFKLEGHQAKTTAVDDTLAYSPYKGLTLVQLRSVQKEFRKRNEEQENLETSVTWLNDLYIRSRKDPVDKMTRKTLFV